MLSWRLKIYTFSEIRIAIFEPVLMILSIMDNHAGELEKLLKPELFKELSDLNMAIQQQFDDNSLPYKKYQWHRGYRHAFRKVETLITEQSMLHV